MNVTGHSFCQTNAAPSCPQIMLHAAEFCGKIIWFFFFSMDIVKLQIQRKRKGVFIFAQQSIQWRTAGDRWLRGSG